MVSLEAIFLTLFVLTSQNRQRARERIRADIEFETSMNTEMKIAYLHEKIDRLAEGQYQVQVNVQKLDASDQREAAQARTRNEKQEWRKRSDACGYKAVSKLYHAWLTGMISWW